MISKTIDFAVNNEHLENGRRGNCSKCPIALAVYEKIKDFKPRNLKVAWASVAFDDEFGRRWTADLTKRMQTFIYHFDNELNAIPFSDRIVFKHSPRYN